MLNAHLNHDNDKYSNQKDCQGHVYLQHPHPPTNSTPLFIAWKTTSLIPLTINQFQVRLISFPLAHSLYVTPIWNLKIEKFKEHIKWQANFFFFTNHFYVEVIPIFVDFTSPFTECNDAVAKFQRDAILSFCKLILWALAINWGVEKTERFSSDVTLHHFLI